MTGVQFTVAELADALGATVEGDGDRVITGVAGLREAAAGDISFLAQAKYLRYLETTRASAVVMAPGSEGSFNGPVIRARDPDAAFQRIVERFAPPAPPHPAGVHPAALVSEGAVLGEGVGLGPYVVVEEGARIGANTRVWAGCYIGHCVTVGRDCILYPHVSLLHHCEVGDRVFIHNGSCIGTEGFGYHVDERGVRTKIEQLGAVWIGDDVEIGSNVTIDRARLGKTRIGHGVKIDNLVQIGHNVVVEDHAVLVAQVGISGSSIVRRHAVLGGQVGVAGHLEIGERAAVGAQGGVTKDVPAGSYVSGYPAAPHAKAARLQAHLNRLPHLKQRVADLEAEIRQLRQRPAAG